VSEDAGAVDWLSSGRLLLTLICEPEFQTPSQGPARVASAKRRGLHDA